MYELNLGHVGLEHIQHTCIDLVYLMFDFVLFVQVTLVL